MYFYLDYLGQQVCITWIRSTGVHYLVRVHRCTLPGVSKQVGEGELFVLQIHHRHQKTLDQFPGLAPRKVVGGAALQGGQGKVHRLLGLERCIKNKKAISLMIQISYLEGIYKA